MTIDAFLARLSRVRPSGQGWMAECPAHEDTTQSLSVACSTDEKILVTWFAGCRPEAVLARLDLTLKDLFPMAATSAKASIAAVYDYHDEGGQHLFDVCRFDPKDFRQRRADGVWKMAGVRRVLYHLDKLQGQTIAYIVEGEKDADRLRAIGLQGTTNAGGAGKWRAEYYCDSRRADHVQ
jgi:hypothetical protein